MTEIPFDLPRATALLTAIADGADAARENRQSFEVSPNVTAELRSIAAHLLSGEQDRERLDWFDANVTKARRHQPDGNVSVSTFATPLLQPGHLSIRDAIDCARSSEGRDNG